MITYRMPPDGTDTILGSVRAWVNFQGNDTVAIRASFNVSSVTDNGVGDYTVNFTNALEDANYAIAVGFSNHRGVAGVAMCQLHSVASTWADANPTVNAFRMNFRDIAHTARDSSYVNAIVTR